MACRSTAMPGKAGICVGVRQATRWGLDREPYRPVVDARLRGHDERLVFSRVIEIARRAVAAVGLAMALTATAWAQAADPALRGHGGPIRAIAVLDEKTVVTGGFDSAIIVWDVPSGTAKRVLRQHESAVTALAAHEPDCFMSGGEDGQIAHWCASDKPTTAAKVHSAPVTALASMPVRLGSGQTRLTISSSWDHSVKGTLPGDSILHNGPVNGLAALPSGLVSASYDGVVRVSDSNGRLLRQVQLPAAINGLVVLPDERIALAAADGRVRVLNPDLTPSFEVELPEGPLMAIAVSPDGKMIATAGMRTPVALIDVEKRAVARRIHGPGLPIWALAFSTDGQELFTGGADRALRRFNVANGEPVGAPIAKPGDMAAPASNEPGAIVFRACAVCHTLRPEEGHRAGPTLHGIMGRKIATAPGYDYSEALKKMDIVWTPETIAKLFEVGPTIYTPGTKMPEQRVTNPDDRKALVEWLAKVTK